MTIISQHTIQQLFCFHRLVMWFDFRVESSFHYRKYCFCFISLQICLSIQSLGNTLVESPWTDNIAKSQSSWTKNLSKIRDWMIIPRQIRITNWNILKITHELMIVAINDKNKSKIYLKICNTCYFHDTFSILTPPRFTILL